jgi:hypothetical protein
MIAILVMNDILVMNYPISFPKGEFPMLQFHHCYQQSLFLSHDDPMIIPSFRFPVSIIHDLLVIIP